MSKGKLILGVLAGAAVGVAIGLILAPEKGEDTRKKIADSAGDLGDKFNDFVDNLGKKLDEIKQQVKDEAGRAAQTADDMGDQHVSDPAEG